MTDAVARAKAMLRHITNEVEKYPYDGLLKAIDNIFKAIVERGAERSRRQYLETMYGSLEQCEQKTMPETVQPKAVREAQQPVKPEKTKEPEPQGVKRTKKKDPPYWHALINYNIDDAKYKYTPMKEHSWIKQTFGNDKAATMLITKELIKISEELDLGFKQVTLPTTLSRTYIANAYPGPVYAEFKRRYEASELSGSTMRTLDKARREKFSADCATGAPHSKYDEPDTPAREHSSKRRKTVAAHAANTSPSLSNAFEELMHMMAVGAPYKQAAVYPNARIISSPKAEA